MKAGEFCRGITEIREGEFGEGEMYNVHDTVCLFLLIVILNTISLKLSSHFSFFGYSCQNKNVILSMQKFLLRSFSWSYGNFEAEAYMHAHVVYVCTSTCTYTSSSSLSLLNQQCHGKFPSFLLSQPACS